MLAQNWVVFHSRQWESLKVVEWRRHKIPTQLQRARLKVSKEWLSGPKGPVGKLLVFAFQLTLAPATKYSSRYFRNIWWMKKCIRELSRH